MYIPVRLIQPLSRFQIAFSSMLFLLPPFQRVDSFQYPFFLSLPFVSLISRLHFHIFHFLPTFQYIPVNTLMKLFQYSSFILFQSSLVKTSIKSLPVNLFHLLSVHSSLNPRQAHSSSSFPSSSSLFQYKPLFNPFQCSSILFQIIPVKTHVEFIPVNLFHPLSVHFSQNL